MKSKLEIAVAVLERISAGDVMAGQTEYTHGDTVVAYQRLCREALAAIQSQPDVVVGGWQPIETAPKDGTRVLLYLAAPWSRLELARWYQPWGNWQTDGDEPDQFRDEYCGIGSQLPTHWQPLPPPPVQAQGSDAA